METFLREELIFTQLKCKNREEVLNFLSSKLIEQNLVEEEYAKSIVEREEQFPTGLPSAVNVAIPHTDNELVKKTSIAVGVLSEPVEFNSMDKSGEKLDVRLVLMLAIKESHGQIEMLQNIINFIQNEKIIDKLINKKDSKKIKTILKKYL